MEWSHEAVVLGVKRHGETSVIAELITQNRGRHLGLVHGGRSRRMRPVLQPGNLVNAKWRARLDEHLGQYQIEPKLLRAAALMGSSHGTYAVQTLAAHLRLLPERDPHGALYETSNVIFDNLAELNVACELIVRFELGLLEALGFGLDLQKCAVTGLRENLTHVSPKTGRAVCRSEAEPYRDRLLELPEFLAKSKPDSGMIASAEVLVAGFSLTGHFLERHIYGPRGIEAPPERDGLKRKLLKQKVGIAGD